MAGGAADGPRRGAVQPMAPPRRVRSHRPIRPPAHVRGGWGRERPPCPLEWAALEHHVFNSLHEEAQIGVNALTLESAAEAAPKLYAIARSVSDVSLKTLILIHEANGVHTLVRLLQELGLKLLLLRRPTGTRAKPSDWRQSGLRCATQLTAAFSPNCMMPHEL